MEPVGISTIGELQCHLQEALTLEYATIPVYLCGWWTIADPTTHAAMVIQRVVIAEMRHMAIAANILIATGGTPCVIEAANACRYPTRLPAGVTGSSVELLPFGPEFLAQALRIEKPVTTADLLAEGGEEFVPSDTPDPQRYVLAMGHKYPTIGEFYGAIITGMRTLVDQLGEAWVFPNGGNTLLQLPYFGTQNIVVRSSAQAVALLEHIVDEGEGVLSWMWDENDQLAHYYSFQEICLGQAYVHGDVRDAPSGRGIPMPSGDQVARMQPNPKMSDYSRDWDGWKDANDFNELFAKAIANLDLGFRGRPAQVPAAIGQMIQLVDAARRVLARPFPDVPAAVAGPTFELPDTYADLPAPAAGAGKGRLAIVVLAVVRALRPRTGRSAPRPTRRPILLRRRR